VLREESEGRATGVFHCFTETAETARAALDLGFFISFSGILTFKTATDLRAVAAFVPLDRCLIETDSPYLAPVPYRGKVNTPPTCLRGAGSSRRSRDCRWRRLPRRQAAISSGCSRVRGREKLL
jgi:TatD family hydrolase